MHVLTCTLKIIFYFYLNFFYGYKGNFYNFHIILLYCISSLYKIFFLYIIFMPTEWTVFIYWIDAWRLDRSTHIKSAWLYKLNRETTQSSAISSRAVKMLMYIDCMPRYPNIHIAHLVSCRQCEWQAR